MSDNRIKLKQLNGIIPNGNVITDANGNVVVGPMGASGFGNKYHLPPGDSVLVPLDYQYWIYGDLTIDAGAVLTNYGQVVIANGSFINNGAFNNFGALIFVTLATGPGCRSYKASFSSTANMPFIITHNLNTLDFVYTIREGLSDLQAQVTRLNPNQIEVITTANVNGNITLVDC